MVEAWGGVWRQEAEEPQWLSTRALSTHAAWAKSLLCGSLAL